MSVAVDDDYLRLGLLGKLGEGFPVEERKLVMAAKEKHNVEV